jgi:hypothetical protein
MLTERCSWIGGSADWKGDKIHPVPRRTLCVTVKGEIEITAGDGEKRLFGPGSVILQRTQLAPGIQPASRVPMIASACFSRCQRLEGCTDAQPPDGLIILIMATGLQLLLLPRLASGSVRAQASWHRR